MKPILSLAVLLFAVSWSLAENEATDRRLGPAQTLNGYFPLTPPASKEAWEARRKELREQLLVANGLWPMPPKTPLQPVIHGKIDRDDYTIEKVFFASVPGHYVSGNLYRPKGKTGKLPGVLCPHGHWANGRFYDAGEKAAADQIKQGAEKTIEGARYPLQARCAQLARMGCVVFHYDMVGNADSLPIAHRAGFTDAEAELRLQSFMGLQTWNSIRALDFLLSLPEIDPARIGVTGASGGGTQTFLLCALDDRPAVAFPAVMVSTAMQGGCICENCSFLRQDTGNIEIAGLFAPKPLGMSGANDWTVDIERKGLPELKALYKLYGAEDKVMAKCLPQFGHNYNQVSRELMYHWLNRHLHLEQPEPVVEKPFQPVLPKDLSVYNDQQPRPKDAADAATLRATLTEISSRQLAELRPKQAKDMDRYRQVIGTALRVMVHDQLPAASEVEEFGEAKHEVKDGIIHHSFILSRKGQGERVHALALLSDKFDGNVVVWVHPKGIASLRENDQLVTAARRILEKNGAILAVDVFNAVPKVDKTYAGYTYGYNRPLLAQRVHDILSAVAFAKGHEKTKTVHLVGFEEAGPWVLLARALCGDAVSRTAADVNQFRFEKVITTDDPMMLPGALKYGGLSTLTGLAAPGELFVHHHQGTGLGGGLRSVYAAAGAAEKLHHTAEKASGEQVIDWLLR